MSYCRFENTAPDLKDCVDNMDNVDPDSKTELSAQRKLIDYSIDLLEEASGLELLTDKQIMRIKSLANDLD